MFHATFNGTRNCKIIIILNSYYIYLPRHRTTSCFSGKTYKFLIWKQGHGKKLCDNLSAWCNHNLDGWLDAWWLKEWVWKTHVIPSISTSGTLLSICQRNSQLAGQLLRLVRHQDSSHHFQAIYNHVSMPQSIIPASLEHHEVPSFLYLGLNGRFHQLYRGTEYNAR